MAVAVATSVPVAVAMALPVVTVAIPTVAALEGLQFKHDVFGDAVVWACLLYTSDAADE